MRNYCKENDCKSFAHGRGYCVRHYKQIIRHGETFKTIYEHRPALIVGDIAYIPVGMKGDMATVDKEFAVLDAYKWCLTDGYAKTNVDGKIIGMHRFVLGDKQNYEIDHINRNKLDNRKANLRHSTHQQNTFNATRRKSKHGYRGVRQANGTDSYHSMICFNGKRIYLGSYKTPEEAAIAYDNMANELHGEFAILNFKEKK
jgi:hypothetical protein